MSSTVRSEASEPVPGEWLIDTDADYGCHKPTGQAFTIDFVPEEFAAGLGGIPGFVAVAIPLTQNRDLAVSRESARYAGQALKLYVELLRRRLEPDEAPSTPSVGRDKKTA